MREPPRTTRLLLPAPLHRPWHHPGDRLPDCLSVQMKARPGVRASVA